MLLIITNIEFTNTLLLKQKKVFDTEYPCRIHYVKYRNFLVWKLAEIMVFYAVIVLRVYVLIIDKDTKHFHSSVTIERQLLRLKSKFQKC